MALCRVTKNTQLLHRDLKRVSKLIAGAGLTGVGEVGAVWSPHCGLGPEGKATFVNRQDHC